MRSTLPALRLRTVFFLSMVLFTGILDPRPAFAASKIKPDLPIGEELNESAQPPAKKGKSAEAAAAAKDQKAQPAPAAPETDKTAQTKQQPEQSKTNSSTTAPENSPSGEEVDPYSSSPQSNTESAGSNSKTVSPDKAHKNDSHDADGASKSEGEAGKLLEGKVAPATPAKGSGFIWFAVVFVVLAIAIFIFT